MHGAQKMLLVLMGVAVVRTLARHDDVAPYFETVVLRMMGMGLSLSLRHYFEMIF